MKKQDIPALLKQAAQLRFDLCSAIDRSLLAHCRRLPLSSPSSTDRHGAACGAQIEPDHAPVFSAAAIEARSLASIRDCLIVLEEQLECLQMLPDEQKAEQKATVAELEESREILLRRLKQHRGREVAVIQQALNFIGASSEECHPLPFSRSYTSPARLINDDMRLKITRGAECSVKELRLFLNKQHEKMDILGMKHTNNTQSHGMLTDLKTRLLGFLTRKLIKVSPKCLVTVAGAAAVLTLSKTAYGSYVHGRKRASSMGRLNGAGCPEKWASVHSNRQQCILTEPFKEDI